MKTAFRDSLALISRTLPSVKGKNRLGMFLIPLLTDYTKEQQCIPTIKMKDGSLMQIDLRSFEKKAFFTGEYDPAVMQMLFTLLTPESSVLDVGANIGFYSIALGQKIKSLNGRGKLWAFEPVKSNFERLSSLIELNKLVDIVHPINTALGNMEGEISIHVSNESESSNQTGNAVWVRGSIAEKKKANCSSKITKLDLFTQDNQIKNCDLIKVDIEGAELEFFLGASNFIAFHRPIIFSEFNINFSAGFGYSFEDVKKLAESWDYEVYRYQGRHKIEISKFTEKPTKLSNYIMIPQEKLNVFLTKFHA